MSKTRRGSGSRLKMQCSLRFHYYCSVLIDFEVVRGGFILLTKHRTIAVHLPGINQVGGVFEMPVLPVSSAPIHNSGGRPDDTGIHADRPLHHLILNISQLP